MIDRISNWYVVTIAHKTNRLLLVTSWTLTLVHPTMMCSLTCIGSSSTTSSGHIRTLGSCATGGCFCSRWTGRTCGPRRTHKNTRRRWPGNWTLPTKKPSHNVFNTINVIIKEIVSEKPTFWRCRQWQNHHDISLPHRCTHLQFYPTIKKEVHIIWPEQWLLCGMERSYPLQDLHLRFICA